MRKGFVKVVHLRKNADDYHDHKHICRVVTELVVSGKREFQRDTECLDRHDRNTAHGTANGDVDKWVLATILRSDLVDHDDGENDNEEAVEHERYHASQFSTSFSGIGGLHKPGRIA